ncbi:hypothetical protein ACNQFN_14385 [Thauera butanivorans]|uniref:hypothetical protein n=1 Tax=Thauera butanivorans TaxID=86174 RepID=UPI003AB375C9
MSLSSIGRALAAREIDAAESPMSASAVPGTAGHGPTLDRQTIQAGYESWLQERRQNPGLGREYHAQLDGSRDTYLNILGKADAANGFAQPQAFLQTLSQDELRALQHMHSLASLPDPATLDEEGALNLLLPRNMSRDLNQDGLTRIGRADTMLFPPNDAPQSVKDAWSKATSDLDPGTRLHLELQMWTSARGGIPMSGMAADMGQADYHKAGFDYGTAARTVIDGLVAALQRQLSGEERTLQETLLQAVRNFASHL